MSYPEGLPATAYCIMEGHDYRGGGACVRCGDRLRCECGQFVTDAGFDAHLANCPTMRGIEEPADPGHSPYEEWVGYPMIACGYCQRPWPCDEASQEELAAGRRWMDERMGLVSKDTPK